jgi:hypothetical protein
MRIYVPPQAGLGAPEISALKRLSRPSLKIIAEELTEPGSHEAIRWILQQRNPEQALAQAVAENVRAVVAAHVANPNVGMGDLLGKSFFKKLVKLTKKITVSIPKKIASAVAKHDPLYKLAKPTLTKVMNGVRKNLPIILTVAGGVLAPFTGGASLAAAAALTTARQLYANRIDTAKAVKAGKAEAGAMQAQVDQQTADVNKQANDVYHQNQEVFLAAGYDEAKWNALSLDDKIAIIQKASDGTLQPTPAAVAAQNQVVSAAASGAASAVTTQAPTYNPPPIPQQSYDYSTSSSASAPDSTPAPAPSPVPAPAPAPLPDASGSSSLTDLTASLPAGGSFTLTVNGQNISNYPTSNPGDLVPLIQSGTQPGDTFEVLSNGVSTGLKVRTATGFISIPDDQAAAVRAMSRADVLAMLNRANQSVTSTGATGPSPTGDGSGSNNMLWLLLAAGGVAVASAKGKR